MNKWDKRFLDLAELVAGWSKDPRTKCGAVIVRPDKSVASLGYNGLPSSIPNDVEDEWLQDRDKKLAVIRHSEENAISFCKDESMKGYTIYIFPFQPCSHCMSEIAAKGITRVVTYKNSSERWKESFTIAKEVAKLSGIELVEYGRNEP